MVASLTSTKFLSAKVIKNAVLSLFVSRHDGGYQFLHVICGTSVDEAGTFSIGILGVFMYPFIAFSIIFGRKDLCHMKIRLKNSKGSWLVAITEVQSRHFFHISQIISVSKILPSLFVTAFAFSPEIHFRSLPVGLSAVPFHATILSLLTSLLTNTPLSS